MRPTGTSLEGLGRTDFAASLNLAWKSTDSESRPAGKRPDEEANQKMKESGSDVGESVHASLTDLRQITRRLDIPFPKWG